MKMIKALNQDKSIKIIGDGSEKFDFIAVEDCAEANILAMKSNIEKSNLNVGTGIGTSLLELANLILKIKNSNKKITYVKNTNNTLVKCRVGSVEKAYKEIGFKAKIKFKDGLKNTIKWIDKVTSE